VAERGARSLPIGFAARLLVVGVPYWLILDTSIGVQSSWHLKRECQRNIELVWLTGRLIRDFKTMAAMPLLSCCRELNFCREQLA
jgi:hypothetical protein